ncbi:hypothetical protein L7F22_064880 [Adiantum nelumboides]|nr:hypothetical protein [Adiantum nelumboides]
MAGRRHDGECEDEARDVVVATQRVVGVDFHSLQEAEHAGKLGIRNARNSLSLSLVALWQQETHASRSCGAGSDTSIAECRRQFPQQVRALAFVGKACKVFFLTVSRMIVDFESMARLKAEAHGSLAERKRGRPKKGSDEAFTKGQKVLEVSVIVSVGGADINVELLQRMDDFLKKESIAGICALERRGSAFNLHFQMVVRLWSPSLVSVNRKVKAYLG